MASSPAAADNCDRDDDSNNSYFYAINFSGPSSPSSGSVSTSASLL